MEKENKNLIQLIDALTKYNSIHHIYGVSLRLSTKKKILRKLNQLPNLNQHNWVRNQSEISPISNKAKTYYTGVYTHVFCN